MFFSDFKIKGCKLYIDNVTASVAKCVTVKPISDSTLIFVLCP